MSPEAKKLIKLATLPGGQRGTVVIVELLRSTAVIAGGVVANQPGNVESIQNFQAAVQELFEDGFLRMAGVSNTAFQVTIHGYVAGQYLRDPEEVQPHAAVVQGLGQ